MTLTKPKNSQFINKTIAQVTLLLAIISQLVIPVAVRADNLQSTTIMRQNQVSSNFQSLLALDDTSDEIVKPDKIVRAVMTAYTSTADQTDSTPCITADGTDLCKRGTEDVLAANWLPIGTQVKIPSLYGDRIFEIHDRMNKRYGYGRMDIWLNSSKADARKFGVKRVDVEIYYIKKVSELAKR
ncbi:MAG: hypothetical protein EXS55_03960 [Candidatus Magasanikbacteria bacterium]|nr:hypothetical protein [Candidatus Magasanikbacteria bacterium]